MGIFLADDTATENLGRTLAAACPSQCLIFLRGDLGTGKTTLSRGFLRGLGYTGRVKSPTYTLLEPYEIDAGDQSPVHQIYHFDLYRLSDPEELTYLGAEDCFAADAVSLVEWPQQGEGMLPSADLEIRLEYRNDGRCARLQAGTDRGHQIMRQLSPE